MGTNISARQIEQVQKKCGFVNEIDMDAERSRGGVSLGWKHGCNFTLRSFSPSHVDVEINEGDEKVS